VFEIAFNAWYKAVDLHVFNIQSVNVREGGKVVQVNMSERLRHEPRTWTKPLPHSNFFHKGN